MSPFRCGDTISCLSSDKASPLTIAFWFSALTVSQITAFASKHRAHLNKFLDWTDRFSPLLISVVLNLFLLVWLANIQPPQPPSEEKTMDVRAVEVEIHPFEPPPPPEPPETAEVDESQDATLERGDASNADADAATEVPT